MIEADKDEDSFIDFEEFKKVQMYSDTSHLGRKSCLFEEHVGIKNHVYGIAHAQ